MRAPIAHLLNQMAEHCRVWQDGRLVELHNPSADPRRFPGGVAIRIEARWGAVSNWICVTSVAKQAARHGYLEKVDEEWHMTQKARSWLLKQYKQWHADPEAAMREMLFTPLPQPASLLRVAEKIRHVSGIRSVASEACENGQWSITAIWDTEDRGVREGAARAVSHITNIPVVYLEPEEQT